LKRFFYPHRYAPREADIGIDQARAKTTILQRLAVEKRIAEKGPFHLGDRFSLADLCLCYWIAVLDFEAITQQFPALQRLYALTRSRQRVHPHFVELEKMAIEYSNLQKGVIP
jgi:glutathione S-transferase